MSSKSPSKMPSPPPLTSETLQYRLMTGNMSKQGGLRGSLTRCAQKFGTFQSQLLAGDPDATQDLETSKQDLIQDLTFYRLELAKLVLLQDNLTEQVERNAQAETARDREVEEWTQSVQASQAQAHQSQAVESCMEEYETVAKLINTSHPQSCRELQAKIVNQRAEIEALTHETAVTGNMLEVREAQFQLLMQYMLDLKRSLNDSEEEKTMLRLAEEKAAQAKEEEEESGKEDDEDGTGDAMNVDDEEEGLYGDL